MPMPSQADAVMCRATPDETRAASVASRSHGCSRLARVVLLAPPRTRRRSARTPSALPSRVRRRCVSRSPRRVRPTSLPTQFADDDRERHRASRSSGRSTLTRPLPDTVRATYILGDVAATSPTAIPLRTCATPPETSSTADRSTSTAAYTGSQALTGGDFAVTRETLDPLHAGPGGEEPHAAAYSTGKSAPASTTTSKDDKRQNAAGNPLPDAAAGGAGIARRRQRQRQRLEQARASRAPGGRPQPQRRAHRRLRRPAPTATSLRTSTFERSPGNWLDGPPGSAWPATSAARPRSYSVYAQDAWRVRGVVEDRARHCAPSSGERTTAQTTFSPTLPALTYPVAARELPVAEGGALSYQAACRMSCSRPRSAGRSACRPSSELYGATSTANAQFINDPNLQPEKSWTAELTAEKDVRRRLGAPRPTSPRTCTTRSTRRPTFDPAANRNVTPGAERRPHRDAGRRGRRAAATTC